MVKVGFICEGKTERLLVESERFHQYLSQIGITFIGPVQDAKGNGNLLPHKLKESLNLIRANGAQKVVILTDLDEDKCITFTKNRITTDEFRTIVVAVRKIESWFLADSKTLSKLLKEKFEFHYPENEKVPFDTLNTIFTQKLNRGIGLKVNFTKSMLKEGFSVQNAAKHPNCPSARYFLNKLNHMADTNN